MASFDLRGLIENEFEDFDDTKQALIFAKVQQTKSKEKKEKDAKVLFMIQKALDYAIFS